MQYTVRVIAANGVGDSDPSEEAIETPREITPPELSSDTVCGETLTLAYNESLDEDSVPGADAFTVLVEGNTSAVHGGSVAGSTVTLTLASAATPEDTVTVSYTAPADPAASPIRDAAGNAAASFSEEALTYNNDDQAQDPPQNNPASGTPTISGTAQVGRILAADTSGISDDGLDNVSFNHKWLADEADIEGATDSSYTLAVTDQGKAISMQVSFTDDAGNPEALASAAMGPVQPRPNTPATGVGRLQSQVTCPKRRAIVCSGRKAQVLARSGMDIPEGNHPSRRKVFKLTFTSVAKTSPNPGRRSVCRSSSQLRSFT